MVPKLYGKLGRQAQDLARRIQAIKIPRSAAHKFAVEYRYDCDQRVRGFELVRAGRAFSSRWATRLPHLDLTWPLRQKRYGKRAGRLVVRDFRRLFFGEHRRLSKQRCEEFFSNDANFLAI
jgi:hypothetical protein